MNDSVHANIHFGRREGYEGAVRSAGEIVAFLGTLQREDAKRGRHPLIFAVHETTLAYLDEKGSPVREPALMLSTDSSPELEMSEKEWKDQVEWYAKRLAEEFEQVKVHVSYARVETKILEGT